MRLYEDRHKRTALDDEGSAYPPDRACRRCTLCLRAHTVCIPPEIHGEGGVLFVGEKPGQDEDNCGRVFSGRTSALLREAIARFVNGPYALDNAVKCAPGARELTDKELDACRPFLVHTRAVFKPSRIVTLGGVGAETVLGRPVAPFSNRRSFTYLADGTPVFTVIHPAAASRNRFVKRWFADDLKWALKSDPPYPPPWSAESVEVFDAATLERAVRECNTSGGFAFDCETYGRPYNRDFRLLAVSLTPLGTETAFVWSGKLLHDPAGNDARSVLRALFADRKLRKIGHNLKFDVHAVISGIGAEVRGELGDTRLWRKLMDPDAAGDLDSMSELVGMGGMKDESVAYLSKIKRARRLPMNATQVPGVPDTLPSKDLQYAFAALPVPVLHRRNALDAITTARLAHKLEPEAKADATYRVWEEIVGPATAAFTQMERWGVAVSKPAIEDTDAYLLARQQEAEKRMFAYGQFDPDSPKQVGELLYGKLYLPVMKRTDKGAPSTDADTLDALRGRHPIIEDILAWRSVATLRKTFARGSKGDGGIYAHIRDDGRLHPTFNLDGARSGRTSCEAPNVQNIPRADTSDGKLIRDAFIAPPGYLLLSADFSQLEIRVAALLSGDEKMKAIFRAGLDFHQRTAEAVSMTAWGIKPEQVTKFHRTRAKAVNFGGMYGKTPRTFAREWGVPVEEAERIYDAILGEFGVYREWTHRCLDYARRRGEVWTWWDGKPARRRPLWRVADQDDKARSVAEHGAWNTPIQGTASDFCVKSLIACVRWILEDAVPAKLVLTVHDQLMFEVAEAAIREAAYTVRKIMTGWNSGDVPLEVDLEVGRAWGSLTKYKEVA